MFLDVSTPDRDIPRDHKRFSENTGPCNNIDKLRQSEERIGIRKTHTSPGRMFHARLSKRNAAGPYDCENHVSLILRPPTADEDSM